MAAGTGPGQQALSWPGRTQGVWGQWRLSTWPETWTLGPCGLELPAGPAQPDVLLRAPGGLWRVLPIPEATFGSTTSGLGREMTMASPRNRPSWAPMTLQVASLIRPQGCPGPASTAGQSPVQEAWGSCFQFFPGPETRLPSAWLDVSPSNLCASLETVPSNSTSEAATLCKALRLVQERTSAST